MLPTSFYKYPLKITSKILAPAEGLTWKDIENYGISVSPQDEEEVTLAMVGKGPWGFLARNPDDHMDMWYINHAYGEKNIDFSVEPEKV